MMHTSPHHMTASETVKELADLCSIPFRAVHCGPSSNISGLTQFLNGAAMADTWICFEHMDLLSLTTFTILIKEI